jgi:hypothetical protein
MGDMIYLLVLFLFVARIVGPNTRVANEASENLQGRDNPTFVYRGFVSLTYMLERGGVPADDLEPYPGAAAHVAIVSEDTREFVHTHGEDVASGGDAVSHHGLGGGHGDHHGERLTFGPRIGFIHTFEVPGLYKIWAEFNHHGDMAVVPFVVEVE